MNTESNPAVPPNWTWSENVTVKGITDLPIANVNLNVLNAK